MKTIEAWDLVRKMLDDLTRTVREDARDEFELMEGLRVLARATALCSEITLDADPARPRFFAMNTPARAIGGPNPDGHYDLAMIDGRRRYRIRGNKGSVRYLGFQVLAGRGLTPRRQALYISDRDLPQDFTIEPDLPEDASAVVVRQYISDPSAETLATYMIQTLDPSEPEPLTDEMLSEQLTAMAWTTWKLTTLHRTIKPELLEDPNRFGTFEAHELGSADTTPDNLYMLGTFSLGPDEALAVDAVPPDTRYWNLTLENVWHECIPGASITDAKAERDGDGSVRIVISARDPGARNWLPTGGRRRGFMTFRWLDNPAPPDVRTEVVRP